MPKDTALSASFDGNATSPRKTAILVVDVQKVYLNNREEAESFISRQNDFIAKAQAQGYPVILLEVDDDERYNFGTPESDDWNSALDRNVIQGLPKLYKTRTSAFDGGHAGIKTSVQAYLEKQGITDIVLTGLHTETCVGETATDAAARGYGVTLISDLCLGLSKLSQHRRNYQENAAFFAAHNIAYMSEKGFIKTGVNPRAAANVFAVQP